MSDNFHIRELPGREIEVIPKRQFNVVVMGDIHCPFEDPFALALAEKITRAVKPEIVILNGDVVDFFAISPFTTNPKARALALPDELRKTKQLLKRLKSWAKHALWIYICGNHSHRLTRYLWTKAPELSALEELQLENLLGLKELGIRYLTNAEEPKPAWEPVAAQVKLGKLYVMHGDGLGKGIPSTYVARWVYNRTEVNTMVGHWHRHDEYMKVDYEGNTRGAFVVPCLCYQRPDYARGNVWTQGMAVVNLDRGGYFRPNVLRFMPRNERLICFYNGKTYEVGRATKIKGHTLP